MKKRILALIVAILMVTPLFAACNGGSKRDVITGFDVVAEEEVAFGKTYSVTAYIVKDANGNVYNLTYTIMCGEEKIESFVDKFVISKMADHVITFTATHNGKSITKTTTLKVKDTTAPLIFLKTEGKSYEVGDTIPLPTAEIVDDVDTAIIAEFKISLGSTDIAINASGDGFVASASGTYKIVATAKDKSGNPATAECLIGARNKPVVGEIENFDSDISALTFAPNSDKTVMEGGYVTTPVSGENGFGGGMAYVRSAPKGSTVTYAYPGFSVKPRQTKEELEAAVAAGYDKLVMRCYLDFESDRTLYHKWTPDGKQKNVGTVKARTWTNHTIGTVAEFIAGYDKVAGGASFIYVGNDPQYAPGGKKGDFKLYIDYISFAKTVSDVAIDSGFGSEEYATGGTIDLSTFIATSATENATFNYYVTTPSGVKSQITNSGNYKLTESGEYIFQSRLSASNILSNEAKKSVFIVANSNDFDTSYDAAAAIADKESEEYLAKIKELKLVYKALIDADKLTAYESLSKLLSNRGIEARTYYNALDNGVSTMATTFADAHTASTTHGVAFDSTTAHGNEVGSTKVLFTSVSTEWYGSLNVTLGASQIADASEYTHIEFYVKGYALSGARPLTIAVRKGSTSADGYAAAITEAPNNTWVKISVPLAGITDLSKITMRFYMKQGENMFGSVWNEAGRMHANISNIYFVKNA